MYTKLNYRDILALEDFAATHVSVRVAQDVGRAAVLYGRVAMSEPVGEISHRWTRRAIRRLLAQAIVAFQAAALRGDV